ncbi:MAG: molybdate ABC transporter substrate-binding protein [Acidimicrobiales bacterium]
MVATLFLGACGGGDGGVDDGAGPTLDGSVTVFAAASLTDAFEEIGAAFHDANPGVTVRFNFAASSALREQILAGAPADVFASANTANMDKVVAAGAATDPVAFVGNKLQIVVPDGNRAGIGGLADFANGDLLLGLCAEEVPCGQFGREALGKAGVTPSIDTNEPDVRSLLTKVEAGELDAGIVYVTDVLAAGGAVEGGAVEGIDIPAEDNVIATYPIATIIGAANGSAGDAFVAFVLSEKGRAILFSFGCLGT